MATRDRIAVVLIHGMGEPRPMATLRTLVDAVAARESPAARHWSKPLDDPDLYDIRRIVMEGNRVPAGGTSEPLRPVVDFYEFYWAHLMQGNRLAQLLRWFAVLVFRRPDQIPRHLVRIYWTGWLLLALLVLLVAAVVVSLVLAGTLLSVWPWIWAGITVVYGGTSYWLLGTLGDAARYLDTRPDNVQARYEIQKAGVDLLKKLHRQDRYHRIVVVGHSLGAMIGYDVLRHAWLPFAKKFDPVEPHKQKAIDALREAVRDARPDAPSGYRELQIAAWAEHIANGGHWRVTDFVTLGSPLAHAELLMAADPQDFRRRKEGRELSTCPPTWDERFGITRNIPVEPIGRQKEPFVRTPDHAGVFAFTRWTNLYSPSRFVLDGDFLSGPAKPVFGDGIVDHVVSASHVNYWLQGPQSDTLTTLVEAMDLTGRKAAPARAAPRAGITPPV